MQGRFSTNLKWSLAGFAVSFMSGVVVTPFLVRRLGLDLFGIAALTTSAIAYVSLISGAINNVAGRYWVEGLHGRDVNLSERVHSTIVFSNRVLTILALGLALVATGFLADFCRIPVALVMPFKVTFWLTAIAVAFNQIAVSYAAISYAYNRLDVQSRSGIVSSVLRMGMIFLCIGLIGAWVEFVAVAGLVSAIAGILVFRRYAQLLHPSLRACA